MMPTPPGWSIALLSAIALAPASTYAADIPASVQTTRTAAAPSDEKALLQQASGCYFRRDYECARKALAQAYALAPRPDTLLKLGLAELESGHAVDAVQHLRAYLQSAGEPIEKMDQVRSKWLPRAEALTTELQIFAPAGAQVLVDGALQEPRAFTTLDEVRAGKPSLSVRVAAGEHDVSTRQGELRESQHVSSKGGDVLELHFQRIPDGPGPTAPAATGAPLHIAAPAGPETDAPGRGRWMAAVSLGSVAVAATAVGLGFAIAFEEDAANAQTIRARIADPTNGACRAPAAPECATLGQIDDAEQRDGSLATGLFIAGGTSAALAVATWLLWPRNQGRGLEASPMVGRDTAGLTVRGAW